MSIDKFIGKIKNITLSTNSEAGEEISFDKEGNVEKFALFRKLFLSLIIILVASLSFGVGRLSVVGDREPIKIEYDSEMTTNNRQTTKTNQTANEIQAISKQVVVSKNGTRYHYLHCSGAKQIKEENKIIFSSPDVAEASGYTLAANCKPR